MSVFSQLLTIIKRATGSKVGSIAEKVVNRVDAPLFDRKAEPQEPYQHGTSHKSPINTGRATRDLSTRRQKKDP